MEHLFVHKLCKLQMEHLTPSGVACIEHYFRLVNHAKKKFKYGNEVQGNAASASGIFSTTNGVVDDRIVVQKWEGKPHPDPDPQR